MVSKLICGTYSNKTVIRIRIRLFLFEYEHIFISGTKPIGPIRASLNKIIVSVNMIIIGLVYFSNL